MKFISDADGGGSYNTFDVDTVVIIETSVFNGNKSMCQVFRHHIHADRNTVGIRRYQFGGLVSFYIVDKSRETGRRNVYVANIGSRCENTFENTDSRAGSDYGNRDEEKKEDLDKGKSQLLTPFTTFCIECLLLFPDTPFTIIHINDHTFLKSIKFQAEWL